MRDFMECALLIIGGIIAYTLLMAALLFLIAIILWEVKHFFLP